MLATLPLAANHSIDRDVAIELRVLRAIDFGLPVCPKAKEDLDGLS